MRKHMVDNEQLYTAKVYIRNKETKTINYANDIPSFIKFTYYEERGKQSTDINLIPQRRSTAESIMIKSDTELAIVPDDVIVIDNDRYNVSKVDERRNASFDLRAIRGLTTNTTKIITLDK
jgi:hypothetical protein